VGVGGRFVPAILTQLARFDDLAGLWRKARNVVSPRSFGRSGLEVPSFTLSEQGAAPAGPWKQAIVHLAQWENEGLPETIEELLAVHAPYSEADLTAWRQQVAGLEEAGDRLELFAAFADIEDAFEPFEEKVTDLDMRVEHAVERELDLQRGK
jgi:hypothetical protein